MKQAIALFRSQPLAAMAAMVWTVGSFHAASWRQEEASEEPGSNPTQIVYWTPAIVPLLTLVLALLMAQPVAGVAFIAVFGSVACFGGRLMITLYRQERLVEALRSSEMRYANLVQMAPDAIFVHVGGRITFANPAAAQTFGVKGASGSRRPSFARVHTTGAKKTKWRMSWRAWVPSVPRGVGPRCARTAFGSRMSRWEWPWGRTPAKPGLHHVS